ncbi:hypothetical protein [Mesorhizobium sp. B2-4-2]|uniref:hypothetical protein n=2 Tax=Mesorhizobium TaxID=68287 RepID=UPI0015E2FFC4|nr:hypothetical protein [Mesorhizobium sp. B2-4-2]
MCQQQGYDSRSAKVSGDAGSWQKILLSMAGMQMLHCTIVTNPLYSDAGRSTGAWIMGFFTEMFARPRPQEHLRYRAALALLHSMSNADRADIGIKPADFPRVAREMSVR